MAEASALFAAVPVPPPSSSQCSTQCHGRVAMISGARSCEIAALSSRKSMKLSKQLVDFTGQSRLQALSGTSSFIRVLRTRPDGFRF